MAKKVAKKVTKKRVKKNVERGQAHIQSSFNNTIVTLNRYTGKCSFMGKCRRPGFRGQGNLLRTQRRWQLRQQPEQHWYTVLKSVDVFVKGPGSGREAAIRALQHVAST